MTALRAAQRRPRSPFAICSRPETAREVAPLVAEYSCASSTSSARSAVGSGISSRRAASSASSMSLCMKLDVEPRLFREVEDERGARPQHRRADRALGPSRPAARCRSTPERSARSSPSAKASICTARLMLIASLSASPCRFADVRRRAERAQERFDSAVGVLVAADHDRERPRLHLWDASRYRRIEHERPAARVLARRAPCLRCGLTVLTSTQILPAASPARTPSGPDVVRTRARRRRDRR